MFYSKEKKKKKKKKKMMMMMMMMMMIDLCILKAYAIVMDSYLLKL